MVLSESTAQLINSESVERLAHMAEKSLKQLNVDPKVLVFSLFVEISDTFHQHLLHSW